MGRIACPGCGEVVEDAQFNGEFAVELLSDGRYLIGVPWTPTWVLHVCEQPGRGGGTEVPARPPEGPPPRVLQAERDPED